MPTTTTSISLSTIATEKARISERIAKYQAEFAELEAFERVMTRMGGKTTGSRTAAASASAAAGASPRRRGRPARATASKAAKGAASGAPRLGEACCSVVAKYPNGCSPAQIMAALKTDYGLTPRPNHLGIALQREKRGGRLQERAGSWYTPEAMAKAA